MTDRASLDPHDAAAAANDSAVRVAAVVVTYQPAVDHLRRLLSALSLQVALIVVVDNGSDADVAAVAAGVGNVSVIALLENRGIAHAQNRGIEYARREKATHVLLLDHDSEPLPAMVANLLGALRDKQERGDRVAAVGPRYVDARHGERSPFVRVGWGWIGRVPCRSSGDVVLVDHLIASGSLIPMAVFAAVGLMREDFFVYYVDIEWGLRAARAGYRSYGVCAAGMTHLIGDPPLRILGIAVPQRDPLRHYYLFRNAVRMYRMASVPRLWKVADGLRLLARFCVYLAFAAPRREQARMMVLGIRHGWQDRGGRLDPSAAVAEQP